MKRRRRRLSCSETRTCATKLASFWRCWTTARGRLFIFQRFGLDDGKPKTLEEIGKKFGVTRERIRQLQNVALAKLRRALAKKEKHAFLPPPRRSEPRRLAHSQLPAN